MEVQFIAQVKQLNVIPQPSKMTKSHLRDKLVVKNCYTYSIFRIPLLKML
jgi:hypothetical protein